MGLDLSHGDYHRGYHAFNFMRNYLCQRAGIGGTIESDDGYRYFHPNIDMDHPPYSALEGKWKGVEPKDILDVLLVHYDCDGKITKKHLLPLAKRMKEILSLPEKENYIMCYTDLERNVQVAEDFIGALEEAHADGKPLRFL